MPITRDQAREIARRFLNVYGFPPTESEDTVIEWDVVLNSNLLTTNETPRNFARRLMIMIARHFLGDETIFIATPTWNKEVGEGQTGTIGELIDFLVEIL